MEALIGALSGAGLAIVTGFVAWTLQRRAEREKWARDTRRVVYGDFVAAAGAFCDGVSRYFRVTRLRELGKLAQGDEDEALSEVRAANERLKLAYAELRLVGSSEANTAAEPLMNAQGAIWMNEQDLEEKSPYDIEMDLANGYEKFLTRFRAELN